MDIEGKNVLVLGGAGLVGMAVCREMLELRPACLVLASRRKTRAQGAAETLARDSLTPVPRIIPVWGDVFIRAEWQTAAESTHPRAAVLEDSDKRRRLIADLLDPLDEDITNASLLTQIVEGRTPGLDGTRAQVIIDCMNTATAVSYQNVYERAQRLADLAKRGSPDPGWTTELETLLASLYVPQLVRHVQILSEAMRRAGTQAYVKVGTSGTGGMGLNIPYTHGEEKPSRLLLSKAALAGAQSLLTFLIARTPGGPGIVKEVKPAAVIGWREIDYGPILAAGREVPVYDCPPSHAFNIRDRANIVAEGDFGESTDETLEGVFIHTGENGQFSAGEFTAITALGQMELVTPEEIAQAVVRELRGGNTGHDIVAVLDGAVIGPSYRGGFLREAAINKLRQLEGEHGESVAFEILGPPRLSKLLFEAYLLKQVCKTLGAVVTRKPEALAAEVERYLCDEASTRRRIISIGLPILLADGEQMLRGPRIKAMDAHHGWVDLTPTNIRAWQERLRMIGDTLRAETAVGSSSACDRNFTASRHWHSEDGAFDVGEVVAWVFNHEEQGRRGKG
jgi:NAD(P)-dependent dehydrogenase (short-subunit alcohol dehydrogenase family)